MTTVLSRRTSGVLLHPTCLPGPHGIGDLGPAAYHFVDWLKGAGQSLWQWLPATPIGPANSPYQSVSAFAGSPLMVALEPLIEAGWLTDLQLPHHGFDSERVDFEPVSVWRMQCLRRACEGFIGNRSAAQTHEFESWCAKQSAWLDDYAMFMALEGAHQGQPWWQWPAALRDRKPQALEQAAQQHGNETLFWNFVQWCFATQMLELKHYANANGVALVGDLPIFIAHHSADCWARPDLYRLDRHYQPTVVAGAPPDALAPQGQHWGNPLYRWDRMKKEGYAWWIARVRRLLEQFDLFRIDHFRGFAAYWEIPGDSQSAASGKWVKGPGRSFFDALAQTLGPLPIIAEDLGLITADVVKLLHDCQFPGMKVLLFAYAEGADHEYLPHNYPHHCVVYTGTHDTNTVHGWWQGASGHERQFAGTYLGDGGKDLHWAMIRTACNSVANTAIFPFQDILGLGEKDRMNVPGTTKDNWSWRFRWEMVGPQPGRILAEITRASGRSDWA